MKFDIRDENKLRKFRPHAERDTNFGELIDLNLYYEHELSPSNYSYKDALLVYLNRASNNISYLSSKKIQKKYFDFRNTYLKEGLEGARQTELYIETKALLDSILSHPDVDKNIPTKYWDKFSNFYGVNPAALHHPHFYQAFEVELEQLEKCKLAKHLVVCNCSNRKPYSDNANYRQYIKAAQETRIFDVCVLSLYPTMLTPFDVSCRYPHICYDWPHVESPGMLYHYEAHNLRMLAYLVHRLKYKSITIIEWGQMKHLHLLRDYYGIDYTSLRENKTYSKYHRYVFSTREFKDGNLIQEWPGCQRQRILNGSAASAQFMVDRFGPKMKKYFGSASAHGIEKLSNEVLEWLEYDKNKLQSIIPEEKIERW